MNIADVKYIHFIGVGGIGMSALARYFNYLGKSVSGYDRVKTGLTAEMETEGIQIHYEEDVANIPGPVRSNPDPKELLIIYTPAVPIENLEYKYFSDRGIPIYKRAEILGKISENYKTIAVAGTHGKTTTASILANIMMNSDLNLIGFIGGINRNGNSNFLVKEGAEFLLTEADEYDRSFLNLHPEYGIVTSVDSDHLDIYGNREKVVEAFRTFCAQVKNSEGLFIAENVAKELRIGSAYTYGLQSTASYYPDEVRFTSGYFKFNFMGPECLVRDIRLNLPGYHNLENCTAAIALAMKIGVGEEEIKTSLEKYKGVKRRFEYHINRDDLTYIDDYAHHPGEIKALLSSVRLLYPGRKITAVFQPHLFSRTRDFGDEFARSLEMADELLLMEIYPAREKPIPGITSQWLLDKVNLKIKEICPRNSLVERLNALKPEIILTIGAGDIDQMIAAIISHFNSGK